MAPLLARESTITQLFHKLLINVSNQSVLYLGLKRHDKVHFESSLECVFFFVFIFKGPAPLVSVGWIRLSWLNTFMNCITTLKLQQLPLLQSCCLVSEKDNN